MKAIIEAKVIEMNKTEAKAAGRVNSEEFKELATLRNAYPNFRIVIKAVKAKDTMKGLSVSYMEKYISNHDDEDGTIMSEFRLLRGLDEDGNKSEIAVVASYGELKMWFLSVYPELERFDVNAILARAKAAREEQKAARQAA
jgi:hypothetical protein